MNYLATIPTMTPEHAEETLLVLQAVRLKLLMEAWTTILLVGVLTVTLLFQLGQLFRIRRTAALVACGLGIGLRYLPSENAPFFCYLTTAVAVMLVIKEIVLRPTKHAAKPNS